MRIAISSFKFSVFVASTLLLSACGEGAQKAEAPPPRPPAVTVVSIAPQDIRPSVTFSGRVEAMDKVDLRARVDGFLEQRLFKQGADVKEGELLYVIEKAPYQAAVEQAQASLQKAEAALKLTELELDRQTELLKRAAGTQARVDDATAKFGQAQGDVLAQKAALEQAKLQLGYTEIRAPLAGRIGRSSISVGNYVGPSSNVLATIVRQDPIYVSFPVSQREILILRRKYAGQENEAIIRLQLADGSRYDKPGKIDFADVTVNPGTDSVQVRASFANPDRLLVDGQLVTVIAEADKPEPVLMVPQQAMQFDQAGTYVLVVDKENKVQIRRIETGEMRGAQTVVLKGLESGERVITEGIQRVRPGITVDATEAKPVGA